MGNTQLKIDESCNLLNNILKNKVDLQLKILKHDSEIEIKLKKMNKHCYFEINKEENVFNIIVFNKKNIVGFLSLQFTSEYCSIINYMCVNNKYYKCGIGEFLGFISIFISIFYNKKIIFSTGISDVVTNMLYERISGNNEIAVSQKILIEKFGFIDSWKDKWDDNKKMFSVDFMKLCKDSPETYLDLQLGNLRFYEKYKNLLIKDPSIIFSKYINFQNEQKKVG